MMRESDSSTMQDAEPEYSLASQIRAGFEARVIELITLGYRKMCDDSRFDVNWNENKFTAVLKGYTKKQCKEFSRRTRQQWHIVREEYNDGKDVIDGDGDADTVPRIDIVVLTWIDCDEISFPFECKLLAEDSSTLIRLYIQKGLIDRYLTDKDYSNGSPWGGMIGYILKGSHTKIVEKLNNQIDRQLQKVDEHIQISQSSSQLQPIYTSLHQRSNYAPSLTVTHLLLPFFN